MSKKNSIYKAAIWVVILEILMKLIAFVKQSVVAYYFGANGQTDIYFVANDFMVSVSETIISAAKVAIMATYASVIIKEGKKQGNELMSKFILFFLSVISIVVALVIVCSPILSKVLAPAFDDTQSKQLQYYIISLSGIIVFTIIIMIYESILNTHEVFLISRIRSLIYSICVIVACVFASQKGVKILIIAQYMSFIIYLTIQKIASKKYFKFSISNPFKNPYIKSILKIMFPIMIGNSIIRINYLIDKAVASSIGEGGISALAYSQMLDQFVVVVIINSISSVMFAHFTNLVAKNEKEQISRTLDNTLSSLCIILIPTTMIVLLEAKNIVGFVYGRGNFNEDMIILTSIALQGYAIRYFFVGIRDITIQGLYAYKEVKRPMINSLVCTIVNILVSVCLVSRLGIFAIALGTSVSAIVGTFLNIISFKKVNENYKFTVIKNIVLKSIPALIICFGIGIGFTKLSHLPRFVEIIIVAAIIYGSYFLLMYVFKCKEMISLSKNLKKMLLKKFNRQETEN